jgi:hypothetical protein
MKKQIETLMELARGSMEDAERNKNSYGLLMYFSGKILAFEYSYALMKGLSKTDFWRDEATNDEFKAMKKRCDELISNCESNL